LLDDVEGRGLGDDTRGGGLDSRMGGLSVLGALYDAGDTGVAAATSTWGGAPPEVGSGFGVCRAGSGPGTARGETVMPLWPF